MFAGKLCEQQNEWNLMLMVSLSVALWHSPCLSTLFHSNPCVLCAVRCASSGAFAEWLLPEGRRNDGVLRALPAGRSSDLSSPLLVRLWEFRFSKTLPSFNMKPIQKLVGMKRERRQVDTSLNFLLLLELPSL